ncbi:MAG: hypothetical protein OEV06_06045 [Anaerolineae bacterium]|nr:hypothetical protein [Anaerolineae bacterium]
MDGSRRSSITGGALLILIGGWLLAVELYEPLGDWAANFSEWPMWVVAFGVLFMLAGVIGGAPGMAVPGAIIAGIGGILFYQNATNEWATWAYAWTLIPGFAGVGTFLAYLMRGNFKRAFREGGGAVVTSLFLFGVFGGFFHPVVGGPEFLENVVDYWPALLILAGLWLLLRPALRRKAEVI